MTSNIGSHIIYDEFEQLKSTNKEDILERTKEKVLQLLRQTIRPEFLNRVDEIIMFSPLMDDDIMKIVQLQLMNLKQMLMKNGIKMDYSSKLVEWIADKGFEIQLGARPIKRLIQRELVNELSKAILEGKMNAQNGIYIDVRNGSIIFESIIEAEEV